MNLRGCGTALVTPFQSDGSVDEAALRSLVAWQVESKIDFLVPCGTTGETPTLTRDEWLRVVEITIEVVAGRVPVVAGATSNSTADAVEKARAIAMGLAEKAGGAPFLTAALVIATGIFGAIVLSPLMRLLHESTQPSAISWALKLPRNDCSRLPAVTRTRHSPQVPSPPQGADRVTPAAVAASSRAVPASTATVIPWGRKVMLGIAHHYI